MIKMTIIKFPGHIEDVLQASGRKEWFSSLLDELKDSIQVKDGKFLIQTNQARSYRKGEEPPELPAVELDKVGKQCGGRWSMILENFYHLQEVTFGRGYDAILRNFLPNLYMYQIAIQSKESDLNDGEREWFEKFNNVIRYLEENDLKKYGEYMQSCYSLEHEQYEFRNAQYRDEFLMGLAEKVAVLINDDYPIRHVEQRKNEFYTRNQETGFIMPTWIDKLLSGDD